MVDASSAIRPDSPHGQRRASVAGRDSGLCGQEGVLKEGCGSEGQKGEVEHETPKSAMRHGDGVSFDERTK